ncbi:MAG TPA: hypothetical protein VGK73_25795 [Polyangiaceae bacterium]
MSDHGHAAHAEAGGGHDYSYAGEPADRPAPDEPHTPGWLPLLGIGLVLSVILGFIVIQPDGKTREQLTAATPEAPATTAAPATAAPEGAANPERQPRALPSGFRPGAMPSGMPRILGSGTPRRVGPGPFAMPGAAGDARRPPRQPPPGDPHAGHDH